MRLLHVIDSLATGGAERVAVNLCNGLAARGHDVHLVTTRADGPLLDEVDAPCTTSSWPAIARRISGRCAGSRSYVSSTTASSSSTPTGRRRSSAWRRSSAGGGRRRSTTTTSAAAPRRSPARAAVPGAGAADGGDHRGQRAAAPMGRSTWPRRRPTRCFVLPNFSLLDVPPAPVREAASRPGAGRRRREPTAGRRTTRRCCGPSPGARPRSAPASRSPARSPTPPRPLGCGGEVDRPRPRGPRDAARGGA